MERKVIFANRMSQSSWIMIALALLVAGGFIANDYGLAYAASLIAGLAVFVFVGMLVVVRFVARHQVAELASDGRDFAVETFVLFGKGRMLTIPIAEIEDWRWTASSGNMTRFSTLGFVWQGNVYRMPFNGAQVLDRDALAALAPGPFARAAARGR